MCSKSVNWLFSAGWLRGFLYLKSLAQSTSTVCLPYPLECIFGRVMSVTIAGGSSGSLSRVLQSPLSHSELYGTEHSLVKVYSRTNSLNSTGRKSTSSVEVKNCSVGRRQTGKRKKKFRRKEHGYSVTKNKIGAASNTGEADRERNGSLTVSSSISKAPSLYTHSQQQKRSSSSLHVDSQQKRSSSSLHVDSQQKHSSSISSILHVDSQQKRSSSGLHVDFQQKHSSYSLHVDSQKRSSSGLHVDFQQKHSSHVDSQQKRSSSSLLPPVEADSPQTARRTAYKPKPVRKNKWTGVTGGGEGVRGAWLGLGESSLPTGAGKKISCGRFTDGRRSRTNRDTVLLSETESVSSIHSSLFTSSSSLPIRRGGSRASSSTTPAPVSLSRFSQWTHNKSSSSSKPLRVSRKNLSTTPSGPTWGWGRGGGGGKRRLEMEDVAAGLGRMSFRHVIVMSGAGISTPSGIPDFRTPGSGLYDNLQKYQLPEPSAVFDTAYFHRNPRPFFSLAKELYPGRFRPSLAHCFVRLLQDKGVLLRNYTQNIDGLERLAGVEGGRLVEAHGSFSTASCTRCHSKHDPRDVKGVVKPDIVFFGEDLPQRFHSLQLRDFSKCDLLLVMGTSLEVEPFASLVTLPRQAVPRVLLNRELVGPFRSGQRSRWLTDVAVCRDVEESVRQLAAGAGWEEALDLIHNQVTRINTESDSKPDTRPPDSSQLTSAMDQLTLQDTACLTTSSSSSSSPSISSSDSFSSTDSSQ